MTDEQRAIYATVRGVLERNGVYMTPKGPAGPADLEKRMLAGMARDRAVDDLARAVARQEVP